MFTAEGVKSPFSLQPAPVSPVSKIPPGLPLSVFFILLSLTCMDLAP